MFGGRLVAPSICGWGGLVCGGSCIWEGGGSKEVKVLVDLIKLLVSTPTGAAGVL